MNKDSIAYKLGTRASKISAKGMPMDDSLFMGYLKTEDPPLVQAMKEYCEGFDNAQAARQDRAAYRRAQFKVVT